MLISHIVKIRRNDIIYGIKTAESEDITGLIQAKHTLFEKDIKDYPDLSTMTIKGVCRSIYLSRSIYLFYLTLYFLFRF